MIPDYEIEARSAYAKFQGFIYPKGVYVRTFRKDDNGWIELTPGRNHLIGVTGGFISNYLNTRPRAEHFTVRAGPYLYVLEGDEERLSLAENMIKEFVDGYEGQWGEGRV